jgi:YaiO family outer membrane protein
MKNRSLKIFFLFLLFHSSLCLAQGLNYDDAINNRKRGDYQEAEKIFSSLIKKDQNNSELWFQIGLVQRLRGKVLEAKNSQKKALKISPQNNDAKLELARLYLAEQNYEKAQKTADEVLKNNPSYLEAQELSSNITKVKSAPLDYYKWRLDLGRELSRFSRVDQNDWQENFAQIGFHPQKSTSLHIRFDDVRRFDKHKRHYEIGFDQAPNKNYNFGFDAGYSPDSTFLPKWRLKARGGARVIRDHQFIGDTWILANVQKDRYEHFDIFTLKSGLGYFITKNLELKGFIINVIDQNDHNTSGWVSRLDWQTPLPKLRIFTGLSSAPETQNAIVVDTKSKFLGGAYEIDRNLSLNLSYTRDDRENSFIRKTIAASISLKL